MFISKSTCSSPASRTTKVRTIRPWWWSNAPADKRLPLTRSKSLGLWRDAARRRFKTTATRQTGTLPIADVKTFGNVFRTSSSLDRVLDIQTVLDNVKTFTLHIRSCWIRTWTRIRDQYYRHFAWTVHLDKTLLHCAGVIDTRALVTFRGTLVEFRKFPLKALMEQKRWNFSESEKPLVSFVHQSRLG